MGNSRWTSCLWTRSRTWSAKCECLSGYPGAARRGSGKSEKLLQTHTQVFLLICLIFMGQVYSVWYSFLPSSARQGRGGRRGGRGRGAGVVKRFRGFRRSGLCPSRGGRWESEVCYTALSYVTAHGTLLFLLVFLCSPIFCSKNNSSLLYCVYYASHWQSGVVTSDETQNVPIVLHSLTCSKKNEEASHTHTGGIIPECTVPHCCFAAVLLSPSP